MATKKLNWNLLHQSQPRTLNLDVSEKFLKETESTFIKNLRFNVNKNLSGDGITTAQGSNKEVLTPLLSSVQIPGITLPGGNNLCIGSYESKSTNTVYYFNWNSNNNHGIYRINGTGQPSVTQTVYVGALLNFQINPQYHIAESRVYLQDLGFYFDGTPRLYLIFTDAFNVQRFIDVEVSIATNSFNISTYYPTQNYQPFYPFCLTNQFPNEELIEFPTRPCYNAPIVTVNSADVQVIQVTSNVGFSIGFGITGSVSGASGIISNIVGNTFYILITSGTTIFTPEDVITNTSTGQTTTLVSYITLTTITSGWHIGDSVTGTGGATGTIAAINGSIITVTPTNNTAFLITDTVTDTTASLTSTISTQPYPSPNNQIVGLNNNVSDNTWQWAVAYVLTDGRQTTWSQYSDLSYVSLSPCESNSQYLSRSFLLTINAGSPLVEKILIAYRNCNGNPDGLLNAAADGTPGLPSDFSLYDTVNKYNPPATNAKLWTRTIGLPNYNPPNGVCSPDAYTTGDGLANTFYYYFDNTKESSPVAVTDTQRLFDALPFKCYALTGANNKVSLANGEFDWDNLPQTELNKYIIGLGEQESQCDLPTCTIIVDCVIHNFSTELNQYIWGNGDTNVGFGGAAPGSPAPGVVQGYGQTISKLIPELGVPYAGLTGILAGTQFSSISQQYSNGSIYKPFSFVPLGTEPLAYQNILNGNYFIQRFYFYNVPQGKYVFRVLNQITTDNNPNTSAAVVGITDRNSYVGHGSPNPTIDSKYVAEYVIDATAPVDGIVNPPNYLVIADLAVSGNAVTTGYFTEDGIIPIELATFSPYAVGLTSIHTDHNGFYFYSGNTSQTLEINYEIPGCDTNYVSINGNSSTNLLTPLNVSIKFSNPSDYVAYSTYAHAIISGQVTDCADPPNPLQGVPVILTHSQFSITDDDGRFTIEAHNNVNDISTVGRTTYGDILIVSQNGACIYLDCASCDPYGTSSDDTPAIDYNDIVCWNATSDHTQDMTVDFNPTNSNGILLYDVGNKGLKNGGVYQWGLVQGDPNGRVSSVNPIGTLNIPTSMQNCIFSPYTTTLKISSKVNLDPYCKTVRIVRTNNTNYSANPAVTGSFLQWVISPSPLGEASTNGIQFVDENGNSVSPATASYIRIYIDGLNNYNAANNFATNDTFEWAPGARIKFLVNGDGTCFDVATYGIIDLQLRGTVPTINGQVNPNATDYFVIDNDTRLHGLLVGAMIELYYPAPEQETQTFFEAGSITVNGITGHTLIYEPDGISTHSGLWLNGQPLLLNTEYTINAFDTYWLNRAIPQNNINWQPSIFVSSYPFEHFAPSDFCCAYCENIGRPNAINIYALRGYAPNEIEPSKNGNDVQNFVSTFYDSDAQDFGYYDTGDITAIHAFRNFIFVCCENDWFVCAIADNYLRVSTGGAISADSNYIGRPQDKVKDMYGLQYNYPRAIKFIDGEVYWADVQRGEFVLCDYKEAKAVSKAGMIAYFSQKLKAIDVINNSGSAYVFLHVGHDPFNSEILVTSNYNNGVIVNTERDWDISANETVVYSIENKAWVRSPMFTPEAYAQLRGSTVNEQLISFANGQPYNHNDFTVGNFNKFYGVQGERVIEFIANVDREASKKWLAIEEYCLQCAYYSDRILSQTGQQSQIVLQALQQIEGIWYSGIFMDENTPNFVGTSALYDGNPMLGTWLKIRLVGNNTFDADYSEISTIITKAIISQRTIK